MNPITSLDGALSLDDLLSPTLSGSWLADEDAAELRKRIAALQSRPDVIQGQTVDSRFESSVIPRKGVPYGEYLRRFVGSLVDSAANLASPRCLGHMSGALAGMFHPLYEVVGRLDQNLVKRAASPSFTPLERQVLTMLHRLVYEYDADFYASCLDNEREALGMICSGGTLANITALWCARNRKLQHADGVESTGLIAALRHHGYDDAVILTSRLAHYSVEKAAGLMGIGEGNVLRLPVDDRGRICLPSLEAALADCKLRRRCVIAVVAVAGSTDAASIDPLDAMADLAAEAGCHLHVDAAWGAPLLFSGAWRHRLRGIERADSVTIDGHKQLYAPLGSSALLLRDPKLVSVIEKAAPYMLHPESGDLGRFSLEGSRPATALYLHAVLHVLGSEGLERALTATYERAQDMARAIRRMPSFELLCKPEGNIVLYRYIPRGLRAAASAGSLKREHHRLIDDCNTRLQDLQHRRGHSCVARTNLSCLHPYGDRTLVALRAVIANPRTQSGDLRTVLQEQRAIGQQLDASVGGGA